VLTSTLSAPRPGDLAACAALQPEGGIRLRACAPGPVVFGPRLYAPKGSRVRLIYELEGLAGEVRLHLALGAERPPILLARGEALDLRAGERVTARFATDVEAVVNEVVAGLFVESAAGQPAEFRVRDVRVELQPP
jgi:hypothetical protein